MWWWFECDLHVTQPFSFITRPSTFSIWVVNSRVAFGRSYILRVYFRELYQTLLIHRTISMDRLAASMLLYEIVRLFVHLTGCFDAQ